jgi:hypothetical protein
VQVLPFFLLEGRVFGFFWMSGGFGGVFLEGFFDSGFGSMVKVTIATRDSRFWIFRNINLVLKVVLLCSLR